MRAQLPNVGTWHKSTLLGVCQSFHTGIPGIAVQGGVPRTLNGELHPRHASGGWDPVVTGLSFPTAMTFGPDGNLYISNKGFGQPTNTAGQILRVDLT